MPTKKPIIWMGSSRSDLTKMPEAVKKDFGGALHGAQEGRSPEQAKALKGKVKGAVQLSEDDDGDTYRAVYTTELNDIVYVLHCFQKKSKSGISTPRIDVDLIERRLKDARMLHKQRRKAKR
ncbi:MAG: type II toxin-antitoxin system RelE/ParE family toxin [Caulobacteraceae bacterium]|nr:type II toxin-antitoxin system RelE/ParE family toxin [Caulobacteraceae bacterium]